MNRKSLPNLLAAAALSILLSFGGIRCLTTAFEIDISIAGLFLNCCIWALAGCIFFSAPKGGRWLLCGLVLLAVYLWRRTAFTDQVLRLCYKISRLIGTAYGLGWFGRPTDVDSLALPLYLWAGADALICSFCLIRRRFTAVAILFSLVPLALCLVLTDTVPGLGGLFCLLLGLILVLLTQSVRRRNADQAARLTLVLSGPVALALALLFLTNPQATYDKQPYADKLGDALLRAADRIPYVDIRADGSVNFSLTRHIPDFVDLQYKGVNNQLSIPVMEVTAESSGTLYLRGRDYDIYTGTQWTASGERSETFTSLHANTVNVYGIQPLAMGNLTIKTSGARSSRYLPYYPDMYYHLQNGACNNPGSETTYFYDWYMLPKGFENAIHDRTDKLEGLFSSGTVQADLVLDDNIQAFTATVVRPYEQYLQLPEDTKSWAETYLAAHLPTISETDSVSAIAGTIAALVRSSASYSLNTGRMPEDSRDFARWFMEDSDTGYCVHYATATTVLLRAAGIPARYVEGYLTEAVAGQTVAVTEKDAHAWAEYYIVGIGWIPLESTAASIADGPAPLRPTEQTTAPNQETTAAPTQESAAAPTVTEPSTDTAAPSQITKDPTDATAKAPGEHTGTTGPSAQLTPSREKDFTVSKPVLTTLCLVLALLVQHPIRLRILDIYLQSGDTNRRCVKNWRFACRLARLAGQTPPEALHELALRASFSPYTLTEEELAQFDAFRSQTVSQLRRRPWWQQIYYRLFRAAY